jgi:hypothetical protein
MTTAGNDRRAAAVHERRSYRLLPDEQCLVRTTKPRVRLYVARGLTITDEDRTTYPDQVLFLDGVYAGAPFLDNERRHYALDHHAGVIRPFTLATCEQSVVLVLMGLPLREGIWRIYVNEPDLDATLAAWVILNHDRLLAADQELLREVMPLVRVEGVIDTHGLDMEVLTAMPQALYQTYKQRLDQLRARELELKQRGRWDKEEPIEYTRDLLERIDRHVLGRLRGGEPPGAPESLRSMAWPERRTAVLVQSKRGIYEVEEQLKRTHGKALAVVVLDQGGGRMTLLQVDPFLRRNLADVYSSLNARDPKTAAPGNVWGGSNEIGGSPRKTGTALSGEQVLEIVCRVFGVDEE